MSAKDRSSAALWQRLGPLLGLTTLIVGLSIASPHFLTVDNLLNVPRIDTGTELVTAANAARYKK